MHKKYKQKGFTLVELLIVISIIIIIFVSIAIILDPAKRLAQARNATRWQETREIGEAIIKYQTDNKGILPPGINGNLQMLGKDTSNCSAPCGTNEFTNSFFGVTEVNCLDLEPYLKPNYLAKTPEDPFNGTSGQTQYAIRKDSEKSFEIISCGNELEEIIIQKR